MNDICVIGNSHTACLKLAWDTHRTDYPESTLTFFATRRGTISELKPKGKRLVPTSSELRAMIAHTSGGRTRIDLPEYDAVLLVGLMMGYPSGDRHFSFGAARQALRDDVPESAAVKVVRQIRRISDIPIFIAHRPLQKFMGAPSAENDPGPYRRVLDFVRSDLVSGPGIYLLEQPIQTITHLFYTRPEFSVGSRRLDLGDGAGLDHASDDRDHMNATFGAACLASYMPIIAEPLARLTPLSSRT